MIIQLFILVKIFNIIVSNIVIFLVKDFLKITILDFIFKIAFSRTFLPTPFTVLFLFFSNEVGSELRENAKKTAYFNKMSSFFK